MCGQRRGQGLGQAGGGGGGGCRVRVESRDWVHDSHEVTPKRSSADHTAARRACQCRHQHRSNLRVGAMPRAAVQMVEEG